MAQKTIIANYGDGESGKTQSIVLVYKKLKEVADSKENVVRHENGDDVCAVFEINGVKVGICSQGDPRSCQRGWMETLVGEDCTIILAACRHYGATVDLIESYEKQGYRIFWTCNARLYERKKYPRVAPKGILKRFNEQWAEEIANLIESWCYA